MRTGNFTKSLIAINLLFFSIRAHSTTGISALTGLEYIYVFAMGLGFLPILIAFLMRRRYVFASVVTQAVLSPTYAIIVIGVVTGISFFTMSHLMGAGAWMLTIGAIQVMGIVKLRIASVKQQAHNKSLQDDTAAPRT